MTFLGTPFRGVAFLVMPLGLVHEKEDTKTKFMITTINLVESKSFAKNL